MILSIFLIHSEVLYHLYLLHLRSRILHSICYSLFFWCKLLYFCLKVTDHIISEHLFRLLHLIFSHILNGIQSGLCSKFCPFFKLPWEYYLVFSTPVLVVPLVFFIRLFINLWISSICYYCFSWFPWFKLENTCFAKEK